MGRLNSIGSSTALRRALFLRGFAGEVMTFMLATWDSLVLHQDVRREVRITAVFAHALINAYEAAGRPWFIFDEHRLTDSTFGTLTGCNDLAFYHREIPGQRDYFTVECKRLHVQTESGFNYLAHEYVNEGLNRFINGKYAVDVSCGGMIGYVMDNRISDAFLRVRSEIVSHRLGLNMKKPPTIICPSSAVPTYEYSADTEHQRATGEIIIHHVFVGISRK